MKKVKIAYLISTGLISALMLMSAGMYFFNNQMVRETFEALGYPSYIIYPLAIAKILGIIAIWSNISQSLKEWAYAGFFFDLLLAFFAHIMIGDGDSTPAMLGTVLLLISYYSWTKLRTVQS